ncbi:MAG: YgiQ family radical SAM protein [Vallitaleaceae bacterium]|jgi:uncharacterized radical SAM protein YgiQ|nr:YgiQ family radical SAM protein [Vallitaleaceae bacterium]
MSNRTGTMNFLPMNKIELNQRGWDQVDFIIITGDAYVDHPSFGAAIIGRLLEANGYKVGVIAQPDWRSTKDIEALGKPVLGFMVTAGNIDSMVNHYTVGKKKRHNDVYTPGNVSGKRPDRATIVYGNLIRQVYKDSPVIIGGIEASLRRMAHYDYWSDQVKRSILLDSQGDLLVYGMAEKAIIEIADAMKAGLHPKDLTYIKGTAHKAKNTDHLFEPVILPRFDQVNGDVKAYADSFRIQYEHTDHITGKALVEQYDDHTYVIQNPPAAPLTTQEFDHIYDLDFMYAYHPKYEALGGIEAIKEIKYSLTSNRGCFGGCHFCALAFHQGRVVQSRSHDSIINEAKMLSHEPDFKGYIQDVGGPTANFRKAACKKQAEHGVCTHKACMTPDLCNQLEVDHTDYVKLLKSLRQIDGIKKVFVRSGIRYDYVVADKTNAFMNELVEHHVSGQLRVAPEHVSDTVLALMGKPSIGVYETFRKQFEQINKRKHKDQYLVPYFISSHPGSNLNDAIALAEYIRDLGFQPDQVQDFYPTPGTISTCMYYTGLNPLDMTAVFVPRSNQDKAMQRALLQFSNPKNYRLVKEALIIAGREDLIGYDKKCLIQPALGGRSGGKYGNKQVTGEDIARKAAQAKRKSGRKRSGKTENKHGSKHGCKPGSKPGNKNNNDRKKTNLSAKRKRSR